MRIRPSLQEIRSVILRKRIISFGYRYGKVPLRVEPRVLGHAFRTRSYVMLAWQLGPEEGWQLFRFSEMWDVEVEQEVIAASRPPYELTRQIATVDTCAVPVS
ncbi:hypothetical protein [Luteolibacter luteus]|uniref:WYL domain-containing protein n=1 Tax=Luteolibacter luteus TaxID=2728835 RepID=A0A858RCG9_9BACT|nr:hypothetical protein [Luteolibacter luteus]QJE94341.1 hypothetical protein HHL09_00585 [Luteolibacter luteus]